MSSYFVTHKGSQLGPYSLEQISSFLKNQKLDWSDYLFDELAQDWIRILEHKEFTQLFNSSFDHPVVTPKRIPSHDLIDELKKRQWYVLKEGMNYGPFSKAELIQMLQGKTLLEHDYVWKQGLDSWRVFAEVEDFSVDKIKEIHHLLKTPLADEFNATFFRRKHVRTQMKAKVIVHNQKNIFNAESLEISEGGVSLKMNPLVHFPIGQSLYLHFSPGPNIPKFNVIGEIVSFRDGVYGLKFVNLPGVVKSFISDYALDFRKVA